MRKILVVADNHGSTMEIDSILASESFDLTVHLGDSELDSDFLKSRFNYAVRGNNDLNSLPWELDFTFEGFNFFICHGHTQQINLFNYEKRLVDISTKSNFDVFLYAHTHIPYVVKNNKTHFACPGSITQSRKGPETYMVITIDEKDIQFRHIEY